MKIDIAVWSNCGGLTHYPLLPLGIFMILLILFSLASYYFFDTHTEPKEDSKSFESNFNLPSISKTWRNFETAPFALLIAITTIIVYDVCLVDAWLIIVIDLLVLFVSLVYSINSDTGTIASIHFVLATILFLVMYALSVCIFVYYYGTDDALGIVLFIIVTILFVLFLGGCIYDALVHKKEEEGVREEKDTLEKFRENSGLLNNKKKKKEKESNWPSWICLMEILYSLAFCLQLTLIQNTNT